MSIAKRSTARRTIGNWVWTAALIGAAAAAQPAGDLVGLINAYRAAPQNCEGKRSAVPGPLAPDPHLAGVKIEAGGRLQDALKARGYPTAQMQAITLRGPASASAAMNMLKQRYCEALLSPRYTSVGISRQGSTWRIVLARPLLAADLGEWGQAGREVLRLANAARAQPRTCGDRRFSAAAPLRWANELGAAALAHSRDMASHNYFSHRDIAGGEAGERATRQGFRWLRVGENIAAGQGSPEQVMSAWLASPPHCENLMSRDFAEMGAAYALDERSERTIYWTQVFGTRR
jgi:uncharacterized protein YkwD